MNEQPATNEAFLKTLAVMVGGTLLLVLGFNFVVDPFNKNRVFDLDIPKAEIAYKMHYPLYKSLEFEREPRATVILGDSRADALKAHYFEDLGKTDVYNMAYGGGTAAEIVDSFWFAVGTGHVKQVWIGLPFNLFNQSTTMNRFREVESLRKRFLPYYFSTLVSRASVLTLGSELSGKALKTEAPDMDRDAFWRSQLGVTTAKYYGDWREPVALKKQLHDIAKYCEAENIELLFFITPTHVDLQSKIQEFDLTHEHEEFLSFISDLGPVLDFDFANRTTQDRAMFKDPYHSVERVNREVAKALIQGDSAIGASEFVRSR